MAIIYCAECGTKVSRDLIAREAKEDPKSSIKPTKGLDERVEYPPAGYYFKNISLEYLSNYFLVNEFDLQNVDIDRESGGDYSSTYALKCKKGHVIGTYNLLWQEHQFYLINPQKTSIKEKDENTFKSEEIPYLEQRLYEGDLQEKKRSAYLLGVEKDYPAEKLLEKRKNADNIQVKIILTYFAAKKGFKSSMKSKLEDLWEEYRQDKG